MSTWTFLHARPEKLVSYDIEYSQDLEKHKEYAKKVGADVKRFEDCFENKKYSAQIDASVAEGQRLGINSTPSFFVNSQLVKGAQPISEFREIIEESIN